MAQLEMKCPKCPNRVLRVDVEVSGAGMAIIEFRPDGSQERLKVDEYEIYYTYEETDGVWCSECGHTSTVREAKAAALQQAQSPENITSERQEV